MKQLLSFQDKRIVNILYALSVNQEYLTLKQIQKMNECSDRTVQSDLLSIKDFWGDKIQLQHHNKVVFIKDRSVGKLQHYFYDVLQQSLHYNLFLSIFFYPEESMSYHADKVHISTSHALRILADINIFLNTHDAMVSKSRGTHFIEGESETTLRYLMADILMQYQSLRDSFPNQETMRGLFKILKEAFHYKNIKVNDLLLNELNLVFYLSILREKQGFGILDSDDQLADFDFEPKEDLDFSKTEINKGLFLFSDFFSLYERNIKLEKTIINEVTKFLQYADIYQNIKDPTIVSKPVYLYMILRYCYPNSVKKLINRKIIFGQRSQRKQKEMYQTVKDQVDNIERNLQNFISENLDELVFWVALEISDHTVTKSKQVLIMSDLGKKHAKDLKFFISNHFPHHEFLIESSMYDHEELIKTSIEEFNLDLIISTKFINFDLDIPKVEINDYLDEHDMRRIYVLLK